MKKTNSFSRGHSSSSKLKRPRIATEVSCFLCLQQFSDVPVKKENNLSLRNVFTFIRVFHDFQSIDFKRRVQITTSPWTEVPVCKECSKITSEFGELYDLMEMTKLKLSWCIEKIYEVMSNKAEEPGGATLRAEAMDLMKTIPTFPRLVLQKSRQPPSVPPVPVMTESPVLVAVKCEPGLDLMYMDETYSDPESPNDIEIDGDGGDIEEEDKNFSVFSPEDLKTPKSKFSSSSSLKLVKKKKKSNKVSCSFCRGHFANNAQLRAHMVQYHCEHFFPDVKLMSVTDTEFKKILVELLFQDYNEEQCDHCQTKVRKKDGWYKSHLITEHYEEMKSKLIGIQKDPDISSKLLIFNPHGKMCECGIYLKSMAVLRTHNTFHCILKNNPNRPSQSQVTHKGGGDLDLHVLKHFTSVPSSEEGDKELQCNSCNALVSKKSAQVHLNFLCLKRKDKPPTTTTSVKKSQKGGNYSRACTYCLYECNESVTYFGNLMFHHLVRFHPEHFFTNVEVLRMATGQVQAQLQRILVDIIFPKYIQRDESTNMTTCLICKKSWSKYVVNKNYHYTKRHLLTHHVEELTSKLQGILKDPVNLEDRLNECNPDGITCPCGIYLPNRNESGKHFTTWHDKYCKMTIKTKIEGEQLQIEGHVTEQVQGDDAGDESFIQDFDPVFFN